MADHSTAAEAIADQDLADESADKRMTELWLLLALLVFVYSGYLIWASTKVGVRQEGNFYRIEYFEDQLERRPGEYRCILATDDRQWDETNYTELRNRIIDSPGFEFDYLLPIHYMGVRFSLKAVEADRLLYVALGSDSYNWESPNARMKRRQFESVSE